MRIVTSAFAVWIRFVVALKNACDSKAVCELILELGCGKSDELTGIATPDSPEVMPGSALHRLGKARRNNARQERGPRRRMRLKSIYTDVSNQNRRVPLRFSKPSGRQTGPGIAQSNRMLSAQMQVCLPRVLRDFYCCDPQGSTRYSLPSKPNACLS